MFDVPQTGAAVQALEGLARDEQHDDRGEDSRDDDGPEVFEDHTVGVHQPHAVGYEEQRHGPQQEARRGTHRFGPHPAHAQRREEQDHADDVPRDISSGHEAQRIADEPEKQDVEKSDHVRFCLRPQR